MPRESHTRNVQSLWSVVRKSVLHITACLSVDDGVKWMYVAGKENRQLRHSPPQTELFEKPWERAYLWYQEDISNNHPGGGHFKQPPRRLERPQRLPSF